MRASFGDQVIFEEGPTGYVIGEVIVGLDEPQVVIIGFRHSSPLVATPDQYRLIGIGFHDIAWRLRKERFTI